MTDLAQYNMSDKLRKEVKELEQKFEEKKKELFFTRFCRAIKKIPKNLKAISFNCSKKSWVIVYKFETSNYNIDDYNYHVDSDTGVFDTEYKCKVSFGKKKKYFLNIDGKTIFSIYINSKNQLRMNNINYIDEIDFYEQNQLIKKYIDNHNIPETYALAFFNFMRENDWDDECVIKHFTII